MKFGIAGNIEKKGLPAALDALLRKFRSSGTPFVLDANLAKGIRKHHSALVRHAPTVAESRLAGSCEILISLGGDGTMLRLARLVGSTGTPILGVNLGKLGFLAEVSPADIEPCLDEILRGDYRVEDRMLLEIQSPAMKRSSFALNDVVVDLAGSARMIDIETHVDDQILATFTGDGIIVSTPTGSTGYALSNGGPIVTPNSKTILISPICPHTLTARPVLVADSSVILLQVHHAPAKVHVTVDGQPEQFFTSPVRFSIRKAGHTTRLVKRMNTGYYQVLREKLRWGTDVRSKR
ncbi:MAG TPA: NAD(+)/NADH kinase [Bacteroidota bacterium]|nr:NAD(+)/NADH kinase [Bacteroidota bacterium]